MEAFTTGKMVCRKTRVGGHDENTQLHIKYEKNQPREQHSKGLHDVLIKKVIAVVNALRVDFVIILVF